MVLALDKSPPEIVILPRLLLILPVVATLPPVIVKAAAAKLLSNSPTVTAPPLTANVPLLVTVPNGLLEPIEPAVTVIV